KAGERHILKVAYEEMLVQRRHPPLRARFALDDYVLSLEAPAFYDAESYHAEVPAPDDVLISTARLLRATRWQERPLDRPFKTRAISIEQGVDRAALYARAPSKPELAQLAVEGKVERAEIVLAFALRSSLLWPGVLVAGATAGMLLTGLLLRWPGGHHPA